MKQTVQIGRHTFRTDFGFLFILFVLFLSSCFALYNSFNLVSSGTGSYYLQRQIMWYVISFFTMFLISRMQNKVVFKYLDTFYKVLLYILIYLFLSRTLYNFTGHSLPLAPGINGAFSWITIPFLGSFQASEFMKVVLIIKTSQIISRFQKKHPNPSVMDDMKMFLVILKWAFLPMVLILLQPDTGVFIIIAFTLLVLLLCSGIRRTYIYILLGTVAAVVILFFYLYFYHQDVLGAVVSQYQLNRIEAWLNPDDHILGSSNQLYTALLSLGSAGLTGHGLQANIISIPEAHTDFIFAAFGQCFGLAGCLYILIICMALDLYLCKMAYNSNIRSDRLVIIGAIAMLFYQQIQNLGMIVGLVPITGITLPLISYGGSSTLSYFILFGFILNMSPVSKKNYRLKTIDFSKIKIQKPQLKSKKAQ